MYWKVLVAGYNIIEVSCEIKKEKLNNRKKYKESLSFFRRFISLLPPYLFVSSNLT